jgi:hypothetical protein
LRIACRFAYDLCIHCMATSIEFSRYPMTTDDSSKPAEAQEPCPADARLIEIGRLAGNVAHKINNHLTTIITFSHLLRDKANLDAQDREDLDLIIRESMGAAALARNLQDSGVRKGNNSSQVGAANE